MLLVKINLLFRSSVKHLSKLAIADQYCFLHHKNLQNPSAIRMFLYDGTWVFMEVETSEIFTSHHTHDFGALRACMNGLCVQTRFLQQTSLNYNLSSGINLNEFLRQEK